jgi:hypothetical protein
MMIHKSSDEIKEVIERWTAYYHKGEVYGFGLSESLFFPSFLDGSRNPLKVRAVFDNNEKIQNTVQNGYLILSASEIGGKKIVVFPVRYYEIKEQLEQKGLREYEDFIAYRFFVVFYNFFKNKKTVLWAVNTALTMRCTLNCRDCNMFIPFFKDPKDIPLAELFDDATKIFSRYSYVLRFALLGGEVLLHDRMLPYLDMLGAYKEQIGVLIIDTNGSVVPSESVMSATKKFHNSVFNINHYPLDEEYSSKFRKVISAVKSAGIDYTVREANYTPWNRYHRPELNLTGDPLKAHYMRCGQPFPALNDGRIYACHIPWAAAKAGLGTDDPLDYVDLADVNISRFDLIKRGFGDFDRGYTSKCATCGGCDPAYFCEIPKAVQVKKD